MHRLNGYKTYIQAALIGVASVVFYLGLIDQAAYVIILGLLGAGTVASLRHAVRTETTYTEAEADTNPANETE